MSVEDMVLAYLPIFMSALALVVSVVGVLVSRSTAMKYGDVAGTQAAIDYDKQKASGTSTIAFRALLNQVETIRAIAVRNSQLVAMRDAQSASRMPVAALETAFLSKESGVLEHFPCDPEILVPVTEYLSTAYFINAQIDHYLSVSAGITPGSTTSSSMRQSTQRVADASSKIPDTLDQLKKHVEDAMKGMQ